MKNDQLQIKNKEDDITIAAYGIGWIAVDKPCGLSIHNDPGQDLSSLLKQFLEQDPGFSEDIQYDETFGVNPVNRIDLETSGIVLFGLQKKNNLIFFHPIPATQCEKKIYRPGTRTS